MTRRIIPTAEKAQAEVDRLQRKYEAAERRHNKAPDEMTNAELELDSLLAQLDYAKAHPALRTTDAQPPASDERAADTTSSGA